MDIMLYSGDRNIAMTEITFFFNNGTCEYYNINNPYIVSGGATIKCKKLDISHMDDGFVLCFSTEKDGDIFKIVYKYQLNTVEYR